MHRKRRGIPPPRTALQFASYGKDSVVVVRWMVPGALLMWVVSARPEVLSVETISLKPEIAWHVAPLFSATCARREHFAALKFKRME